MKLPRSVREEFRRFGRQGGEARARRLSPTRRRAVARRGALTRWIRARFGAASFAELGLPGGDLIDRLVADFDLECNPCGYPILGPDLRWAQNIYATGPLAELQLGPCARNIVGARNAGRHLLHGLGFDRLTHAGQ